MRRYLPFIFMVVLPWSILAHEKGASEESEYRWEIELETITGKNLILDGVRPRDTIAQFRYQVARIVGLYSADQLVLVFNGSRLKEDNLSLLEVGVRNKSKIYMKLNL